LLIIAHQQLTLASSMYIELEEVVVQDISDDALELAAGGAQARSGVSC
jgi:hypothetical protein